MKDIFDVGYPLQTITNLAINMARLCSTGACPRAFDLGQCGCLYNIALAVRHIAQCVNISTREKKTRQNYYNTVVGTSQYVNKPHNIV